MHILLDSHALSLFIYLFCTYVSCPYTNHCFHRQSLMGTGNAIYYYYYFSEKKKKKRNKREEKRTRKIKEKERKKTKQAKEEDH